MDDEQLPPSEGEPAQQRDATARQKPVETQSSGDTVISSLPPYGHPDAIQPPPLKHQKLLVAEQLIGERLDHYYVESFIGGGGMGAVFRAKDEKLNRLVAIKVLTYRQGSDHEVVQRFQQEARNAAQLDHPNIATVYDVDEAGEWNYIVFELVEGENLRDVVQRRGVLTVSEAAHYVIQVALALEHANERDIVHRDIKPSNVLVTTDQNIKVVDMGLARAHEVGAGEDELTESGMTLGTFDYISPEQGNDPRSADVRSDLYSLGCTFFFMLTGHPPYPEGTALKKLLCHTNDSVPDPRTHRPELPEYIVTIIRKLMAKKPVDRFQSPSDLVAALDGDAPQQLLIASSRRNRTRMRRMAPWLVPMLLLVFGAVAIDWAPRLLARDHSELPDIPVTPSLTADEPDIAAPIESNDLPAANTNDSGSVTAPPAIDGSTPPKTEPFVTPVKTPPARPDRTDLDKAPPSSTPALLPAERQGIRKLIVRTSADPNDLEKEDRSTLVADTFETACRWANKLPGLELIELDIQGTILSKPVLLTNPHLTIRSAQNSWPTIRFQPQVGDPAQFRTSMLTILGGSVLFENVHFELDIPDSDTPGWTLFRIDQARDIRLVDCWIQVSTLNTKAYYYGEVAGFQVVAPPIGSDAMPSGTHESAPAEISLENCILRGQVTVLRIAEATATRFQWHNGLLATSERMLSIGGTNSNMSDEQVDVELEHVTALMGKGLCLSKTSSSTPRPIPITIRSRRCIYLTSDSPLLDHDLPNVPPEETIEFLRYDGSQNFYEGIRVVWQRYVLDKSLPDRKSLDVRDFDAWQALCDQLPTLEDRDSHLNTVIWQQPLPSWQRPYHLWEPTDFVLNDDDRQPAQQQALESAVLAEEDAHPAGLILKELPMPPERIDGDDLD